MNINIKLFDELTSDELYRILELRARVFVVEQNCAYNDMDFADQSACHVFFTNGTELMAYLRIIPLKDEKNAVKIGRVVCSKRRTGLGTELLKEGINAARTVFNAKKIIIHAQSYVKDFYARQGFVQTSEEFLEVGIPHVGMELNFQEVR